MRARRQEALWGALCVVGSAVAFSAKAVIAKVGYRHGADLGEPVHLLQAVGTLLVLVGATVVARA